ncbi:hypothetical protein NN561_004624 [Cricetulus griseus]
MWALEGTCRAGRGARRSPRTGEPGLAQVHALPRTRDEARPRAPSAAGARLTLASASRPSPRCPLPHAHTRAARLTPHFTAAAARSTRAAADPAPSGTQLPGAAPTTARPRTAHACTRRLYPTRRRLRFRSGYAAHTTSPGRPRARPAAWRAKEPGVFLVPGRRLKAARGALGPCAALHPGACSFRGPRGLAWDMKLWIL